MVKVIVKGYKVEIENGNTFSVTDVMNIGSEISDLENLSDEEIDDLSDLLNVSLDDCEYFEDVQEVFTSKYNEIREALNRK